MNTDKYEKIKKFLERALADIGDVGGNNDVAVDDELLHDAAYYIREALKELG